MPYNPFDELWFRQMLDLQRQLDDLSQPYSAVQEQLRLVEDLKASMVYPHEDLWRPEFPDMLGIVEKNQEVVLLAEQIGESLGSVSAVAEEIKSLQKSSLFDEMLTSQRALYDLQDQLGIHQDFMMLATERVESVLAAAQAASQLLELPALFGDLTLEATGQYQYFLAQQYKKLKRDSSLIAERRLTVADFCGDLFETVSASIEIGGAISEEVGDHEENKGVEEAQAVVQFGDTRRSIYSNTAQHLGFVFREAFEGDVELSFNGALPPRIVYLGFAIIDHVYKINTLMERARGFQVFKATTRTMRACGVIPSRIASGEQDFCFLVDQLFFLLYEGAGGSTNRLTDIADNAALNPLWTLKHLRLDARHDIDHGDIGAITKKRATIRDAYIFLIGKAMPVTPRDWQAAQLRLYEELERMLRAVVDALPTDTRDS